MTADNDVGRTLLYLRQGVSITQRYPRLFTEIVLYFSAPALLAALLAGYASLEGAWSTPLFFFLDSITTVVCPVIFMIAVGAGYRVEPLALSQVVRRALPWLPRYVWTNVHTSMIFWLPVGGMLFLWTRSDVRVLASSAPEWVSTLVWPLTLGAVAMYFHSRTLLAPFLAVHSDLPGTRAAWESWQLSGRYMGRVMATFVLASAPLAAPCLVLMFILVTGGGSETAERLDMVPHLIPVGIQMVRVTLIPAAYMLYRDLWDAEAAQRQVEGGLALPVFVQLLLALTAWLPPLGPMGRREGRVVALDRDAETVPARTFLGREA